MRVKNLFRVRIEGNHHSFSVFPMGFIDKLFKNGDVAPVDSVEITYSYEGIPEFMGYIAQTFNDFHLMTCNVYASFNFRVTIALIVLISSPIFLDNSLGLSVDNPISFTYYKKQCAEVAELVDALGSGSSGEFSIGVQVPASAPQ